MLMRAGEMPLPSLVPTIIRASFVIVLAMAGCGISAPIQADPGIPAPSAAGLERLSEFFDNEVATGKLAGAIVLIQQHGRPVYLKCFGVRDIATKRPMTPDTIFALHSMTKPITNLAAMMLIDQGRLSLTDPVSKYIPAYASVQVGLDSKNENGTPILKLVPPNRPVNKLRASKPNG
jgi:CubicO group peptidase (beta-lactamase class C family)